MAYTYARVWKFVGDSSEDSPIGSYWQPIGTSELTCIRRLSITWRNLSQARSRSRAPKRFRNHESNSSKFVWHALVPARTIIPESLPRKVASPRNKRANRFSWLSSTPEREPPPRFRYFISASPRPFGRDKFLLRFCCRSRTRVRENNTRLYVARYLVYRTGSFAKSLPGVFDKVEASRPLPRREESNRDEIFGSPIRFISITFFVSSRIKDTPAS